MSRAGYKFTRSDDYEYARGSAAPSWLEEFAVNMDQKRTAVEVARNRDDGPSFVDHINAIMGNRSGSPYSSVEEAVADYQKRTGLVDYQKRAMANEIVAAGLSAEGEDTEKKSSKPELLSRFPEVATYIKNTVETQHGIQLPAILHGIMELFGRSGVQEGDVYGDDMCRYISALLPQKTKDNNLSSDLGLGRGVGTEPAGYELNDGNRDPFINLVPKKY